MVAVVTYAYFGKKEVDGPSWRIDVAIIIPTYLNRRHRIRLPLRISWGTKRLENLSTITDNNLALKSALVQAKCYHCPIAHDLEIDSPKPKNSQTE